MMNESEMNDVQALIMRQLFSKDALRFSEINTESIPSDQLSYHLRQLLKYGLIDKTEDNRYRLSIKGRGRAIMLDNRTNKLIQQGFIACRIHLSRQRANSDVREYLVQRRTRVPYFGYLGEPGGKILFGEDVTAAAKRNMQIETGLICDMSVKGLVHFKDNFQGQIVQDKFFFVIQASNPQGELRAHGPTGENSWMTWDEILAYPQRHNGFVDMLALSAGESFEFLERTHFVDEY